MIRSKIGSLMDTLRASVQEMPNDTNTDKNRARNKRDRLMVDEMQRK